MRISTKKIRIELARQNLNMKQFCNEQNISYNTFCCLMKGYRNGNLKTIGRIAKGLNLDVSDIIEEE